MRFSARRSKYLICQGLVLYGVGIGNFPVGRACPRAGSLPASEHAHTILYPMFGLALCCTYRVANPLRSAPRIPFLLPRHARCRIARPHSHCATRRLARRPIASQKPFPRELDLPCSLSSLEAALGHAYPLAVRQLELVLDAREGTRAVVGVVHARCGRRLVNGSVPASPSQTLAPPILHTQRVRTQIPVAVGLLDVAAVP